MQANPAACKHKNNSVPPRCPWMFLKLTFSICPSQRHPRFDQESTSSKALRRSCRTMMVKPLRIVCADRWIQELKNCTAVLSVWAINFSNKITAHKHKYCRPPFPAQAFGTLAQAEDVGRQNKGALKSLEISPTQRAAEGSSLKNLALNVVTGQCRCNLCGNTSAPQKHYNNSLFQFPWAMFLGRIKIFL